MFHLGSLKSWLCLPLVLSFSAYAQVNPVAKAPKIPDGFDSVAVPQTASPDALIQPDSDILDRINA
jgi:hypothetical protein